jgi:hypothetical protein
MKDENLTLKGCPHKMEKLKKDERGNKHHPKNKIKWVD